MLYSGVAKEDINITLQNNELIVSGEAKNADGLNARRKERKTGSFKKVVRLPTDQVDTANIKAESKDGVLSTERAAKQASIPFSFFSQHLRFPRKKTPKVAKCRSAE